MFLGSLGAIDAAIGELQRGQASILDRHQSITISREMYRSLRLRVSGSITLAESDETRVALA
jgi:hypothetical protein